MRKLFLGTLIFCLTLPLHAQNGPMDFLGLSGSQRTAPAPQTPVVTPQHMDALQPGDRAAVRSELARFDPLIAQHCTTQRDGSQRLDVSCGVIDVRNGDPRFQPEGLPRGTAEAYYARIPRNSKVDVITACDTDGRFRTRVYYTNAQGQRQIFRTPFSGDEACLTSPGRNTDPQHPEYRTRLPERIPASGHISTWHVVSDAKSYEGAQMPWTIWLNNSGYAYHSESASTPVDGYPASAGCFRLSEPCARGLFYLARRVGTNNMNFHWRGYQHPTENRECNRPSNVPNPIVVTEDGSRRAREEVTRNHRGWFRNWWQKVFGRQPPAEGTPPSAAGNGSTT